MFLSGIDFEPARAGTIEMVKDLVIEDFNYFNSIVVWVKRRNTFANPSEETIGLDKMGTSFGDGNKS